MDDPQRARLRTYAWNYFAFHAEQRMKTFHFYLILTTAILGGVVVVITQLAQEKWATIGCLGGLLAFISCLFGLLDRRNRNLVKTGENALKYLDTIEPITDATNGLNPLQLFAGDERQVFAANEQSLLRRQISYSHVLAILFWTSGLLGIALVIFSFIASG
ncbi:MAG: hypothetical protein PHE83_01445 [Opitutaceae bacterium]|nr:hypothetical protein [Opitutaceae bacterium]